MVTARGNGSVHDAERAARGRRQLQPAQVVHRPAMVVVGRVRFDGEHHRVLVDEAGDVVDMAVGVVADASFTEPDGVGDAEPLGEERLVVGPPQAGVAHLHVAQQPLLGHEQDGRGR